MMGKKDKEEKLYTITCTYEQLHLIAMCVEDISRFMSGQMELCNATSMFENYSELSEKLAELQPLVTPFLGKRSNCKWNGMPCPDKRQEKFIAMTYGIYREILHYIAVHDNAGPGNVYTGETLHCSLAGRPIEVKEVEQ